MKHRFVTVYRAGVVVAPSRALPEQQAALFGQLVLAGRSAAPTGTVHTYDAEEIRGRQTASGWGRTRGGVRRRDGVERLAGF